MVLTVLWIWDSTIFGMYTWYHNSSIIQFISLGNFSTKDKQFLHYGCIKHSGILPHIATYGHTESIFPQNLQKWSHIIWNILKTCTYMKIQVVFRIFKASHTGIPATSHPLPFPLGPKQVSYSPTWLGMATQGSIFPQSLQNWFVDMTLFIMAIIKHTGILPHMATICHT